MKTSGDLRNYIVGAALASAAVVFLPTPAARAAIIDNINGSATPAFVVYGGPQDIGWYYTPTITYDLTGISTNFEPLSNGTGPRTITVQIQTERPVNGGSVLRSGTFSADSATGGVLGATFTSVHLTAGTTYFVDFLNTIGMGVNLGSWANDINTIPHPSNGATTNLNSWYGNAAASGSTNFTTASDTGGAYYTVSSGNVSFAEPILFFNGSVAAAPEPASLSLLAVGACALLLQSRRRARINL